MNAADRPHRELVTLLAAVRREHGMTLLSGKAGIGKTRPRRCLAEAADHGVTVLIGRAHPLHASLAYAHCGGSAARAAVGDGLRGADQGTVSLLRHVERRPNGRRRCRPSPGSPLPGPPRGWT